MSILIKGMEIPKSPVLFCIHPNGKVFADLYGGWREYKAVPVPDHGRLIDTSAKVQTQLYDDQIEDWIDADMTVEEYLGYCFNEVPTIIPADKEGDT